MTLEIAVTVAAVVFGIPWCAFWAWKFWTFPTEAVAAESVGNVHREMMKAAALDQELTRALAQIANWEKAFAAEKEDADFFRAMHERAADAARAAGFVECADDPGLCIKELAKELADAIKRFDGVLKPRRAAPVAPKDGSGTKPISKIAADNDLADKLLRLVGEEPTVVRDFVISQKFNEPIVVTITRHVRREEKPTPVITEG